MRADATRDIVARGTLIVRIRRRSTYSLEVYTNGGNLSDAQVMIRSASLVTLPVTSLPASEGYLRLYEDGDPYCPREQYHCGFSM